MRWIALIGLLAGCRQLFGFEEPVVADRDAPLPSDIQPDVVTGPICVGTFTTVCLDAPADNLEVQFETTTTISSDACVGGSAGTTDDVCVVAGRSVKISGTLRGVGNKPLVVIGLDSILVDEFGAIDVSSHPNDKGSGARNCTPATAPTSGGGGAGGSLELQGGDGGGNGSGVGGMAEAPAAVTSLRGGCRGGAGAGVGAGSGGLGGGAVVLIAPTIQITGLVNASGAGGDGGGGVSDAGGGGGGSGGVIVIEAASSFTLNDRGRMIAQGGGGGGGGQAGSAGQVGFDPDPNKVGIAAAGGSGGGPGTGIGGAGGTSGVGGTGGNSAGSKGGAGGGGATGVIHVTSPAPQQNGEVAPPITQ